MNFQETFSDAVRYWEFRRIIYNGILALVTIGMLSIWLFNVWKEVMVYHGETNITTLFIVWLCGGFFVSAVIANLCYSIIYIPEMIAQFSPFRKIWLKFRWIPLLVGTAFSAILAIAMTGILLHGI